MRHERGNRGEKSILGAAFSSDERRILSWGADGTARLWEIATGHELVPAMRP